MHIKTFIAAAVVALTAACSEAPKTEEAAPAATEIVAPDADAAATEAAPAENTTEAAK